MTNPLSPFRTAADDEISALILSLHDAGERLQELTAGEVDAVSDPKGQSFLLQKAQTHLRRRDASRQAAILNSLPANIALLDPTGAIVSVNGAWRQFAMANDCHWPGAALGVNYLEVCDGTRGDEQSDAARAAAGVRAVLNGTETTASIEYPCHSPEQRRWFQMIVTPMADNELHGAVVMHLDITQRVLADAALVASEHEQRESARLLTLERSRLLAAQRVAKIGDWELEVAGNSMIWSDEMHRIHETNRAAFAPRQDICLAMVHPADRAVITRTFLASLKGRGACVAEHRILLPGGQVKFLEERWRVERDAQKLPARLIGTCQDITERKLAEIRIQRLNRGYQVLSQISELLIRVADRDQLFRDACRIAVETGGFPQAWIGVVDDAGQKLTPVASEGANPEFLQHIGERLSLADDAPLGYGPSALAVRQAQAVIINDISRDQRIRHPEMHTALGIRSLISLPIMVGGEVRAVLGLHATDADYFDDPEIKLLTELADDIGFAIDHIGKAERLDYLAYYDSLTGLANRSLFLERAAQCLRAASSAGRSVAMVLLDMERFKNVNDSVGRPAGDQLLQQVATWIGDALADATLLARVGSDHFALLLPSERDGDVARQLDRLIASFHEHAFVLEGNPFRIAAKFGVATFPDDATDAEGLFNRAESALKKAKASGTRMLFYTQKMTESVARKLNQENLLRQALEKQQFVLHYQPKVSLLTGKVTGAEALIRWQDPRTGLVPPAQFIPILEETGLIHEVGRWSMRKAIADYARWQRLGLRAVRVAVNVSPLQLRDAEFINEVSLLLKGTANAAQGLEIEITESMIMADIHQSIATLEALRDMGLSIAIDDFGTGFSSLAYLSRLPVDILKIDRSFINDINASPEGLSLVSTMITLAHSLNLKVVAEGVETEEQSGLLRLLRCDEMQGFLFSRPLACDAFEAAFLQ